VSYPNRSVVIKAWVPGAVNTKKTVSSCTTSAEAFSRTRDHDELYWNATGTEWTVPIASAEVYVTLPGTVSDADVRTAGFTGPLGAVGRDYAIDRIEGYWRFKTTRALRPREGVTVLVDWPSGHIAHPLGAATPGVGVLRSLAARPADARAHLGGFVWSAFGRDPGAKRSVKPEYRAAADLIPAQAGVLLDERAHTRDVVATIVDLAVRGYLSIEPVTTAFGNQDYMFKQLKAVGGDPDLKDFELFVLAKVFGGDWAINMRLFSEVNRTTRTCFPPIRDRLYRLMVQDGLFPASPGHVRAGWMLAGAITAVVGFMLPSYGPDWLGFYEPWLRIAMVGQRPDLRRMGLGHAAQDVDGRAAGSARARLPGVPRARREGSPRAHAARDVQPVAPVGDCPRCDRALDPQLPGTARRHAVVVFEQL